MMTLADVVDDKTGRAWFREQWRNPEFVAEQIYDPQWEALAILLAHPEWSQPIPASLFANDERPEFFSVFKNISSERQAGEDLLGRLCGKQHVAEKDLLCIWEMLYWPWADYANSRWRLDCCLDRLRKIVAWQYRQEKNRRKTA